ncbi:Kv channel-interacting protein 1 like protein [Argiope bruennichi]|uniref:Kv channel-interacting protein 1 like protein n=1 Tax=Argiope bruennichi TaxID=94029 RepID=A0A8T0G0G6_ARGBR|nr:Kv channel-interacting protein 1 like protein [Argiope bruennichi]
MERGCRGGRQPARLSSLEELCRITKFTKKELQCMYRGFKEECPNGFINEETFKAIFSRFFPYGNATLYASYVFRSFDESRSGSLTFQEFVQSLSLLCHGTLHDKLEWTFCLYDLNDDGRITRKALKSVIQAVYNLVGKKPYTAAEEEAFLNHVDRIFKKMDVDKDGVISKEDFMEACLSMYKLFAKIKSKDFIASVVIGSVPPKGVVPIEISADDNLFLQEAGNDLLDSWRVVADILCW